MPDNKLFTVSVTVVATSVISVSAADEDAAVFEAKERMSGNLDYILPESTNYCFDDDDDLEVEVTEG